MQASSAAGAAGSAGNIDARQRSLAALVAQAQQGDDSAFGHLAQRYWRYLLLLASRELAPVVRSRVAPSDLVQETLIRARHGLDQFQGTSDVELRAWLRQILLYRSAHVQRQHRECQKRDVRREVRLDEVPPLLHDARLVEATEADTPSKQLATHEEHARLFSTVEQLPAHYRQIILMRNMELLPFTQIAEILETSPDTVRKLWLRAIRYLRQELTGEADAIHHSGDE